MGPSTITVMCRRIMEVIPFIFEVVFVLGGAINHYPRVFDNNRKRLTPKLLFQALWFSEKRAQEVSHTATALPPLPVAEETQSGQFVSIAYIHILPTSKIACTGFSFLRTVWWVSQTRIKPNRILRILWMDFSSLEIGLSLVWKTVPFGFTLLSSTLYC